MKLACREPVCRQPKSTYSNGNDHVMTFNAACKDEATLQGLERVEATDMSAGCSCKHTERDIRNPLQAEESVLLDVCLLKSTNAHLNGINIASSIT